MKKLLYALPILILLLMPIVPAYAFTGNLDGRVIFGQSFTLKSGETLNGDLVVFGGAATVEENATVKGNVVIIGGSLVMDGQATGDAVVIGGLMTMGDKSSVAGNVTTVGGSLQRAAGAQVGGQIVSNVPAPNVQTPATPNIPAPRPSINIGLNLILRAFGVLGTAIVFAALAMLLVIFLQPQLDRVAQAIVTEPIIAGGIGLLTTFISPIALLILVVILVLTLILIPVAVLAVFVWATLIALAWLFGVIALGLEVGERFTKAIHQSWAPVLSAGFGTFLLMFVVGAFGMIPCIGWIPEFLIGMVGIGAVVMTMFGSRPLHRPAMIASSPEPSAAGTPPIPPAS
ncbi:MAG: hypothetical protein WBW94_13485 [Anaerolineales bacterium]